MLLSISIIKLLGKDCSLGFQDRKLNQRAIYRNEYVHKFTLKYY